MIATRAHRAVVRHGGRGDRGGAGDETAASKSAIRFGHVGRKITMPPGGLSDLNQRHARIHALRGRHPRADDRPLWPGRVAAKTTSDVPWGFWDVLPTLSELAGTDAAAAARHGQLRVPPLNRTRPRVDHRSGTAPKYLSSHASVSFIASVRGSVWLVSYTSHFLSWAGAPISWNMNRCDVSTGKKKS